MAPMRKRSRYSLNDPRVIACKKAIRLSGGMTELARLLSKEIPHNTITPQGVYWWEIVPAERALKVSQISGVSVHELRPDVFGSEPRQLLATG